MIQIKARFFNGRTIGSDDVTLNVDEEFIRFSCESERFELPIAECHIESPIMGEAIVIETPSEQRIEILPEDQNEEVFNALLSKRSKLLHLLENNKKSILFSFVTIVASMFFFFNYGAPFISGVVANTFPQSWANKLDSVFLTPLDENYLKPSELSAERQAELTEYFLAHTHLKIKILYRKGGPMKANAFALTGETVIFTDELVNHIKKKELLLSIFLHEVGHLEKRHLLAKLISVALVNVMAMAIIGDIEGITESLANVAMTMISLNHSREYETEADLYSGEKLAELNKDFICFENSFESLRSYYKGLTPEEGSVMDMMDDYFSSHPDIKDRIESVKPYFKSTKPKSDECAL